MTVEKMINDIKDLDEIIISFTKAQMSDATEEDKKDALKWIESYRPISFLRSYKKYLMNLEVEENE